MALLRAVIYGRVQGVYFRDFTLRHATALGLTGYVRNLPGGSAVEVEAEGEKAKLSRLLEHLQTGPRGAQVDRVESEWSEPGGAYTDFSVRH
ncbi:MAG: acylphosphatase [Chloroflexi bacterium]|nr:acylphosphatase [Chloroflexota bacterium]